MFSCFSHHSLSLLFFIHAEPSISASLRLDCKQDQFGEEWSTLLAAQTAHTAELDALRKANLQLSLQVRQLEASLSAINLEHCDLVQQVVKSRLEREELEDELVRCKFVVVSLSHFLPFSTSSINRD